MGTEPTRPILTKYDTVDGRPRRRWSCSYYDDAGKRRAKTFGFESETSAKLVLRQWEEWKKLLELRPDLRTPGGREAEMSIARLCRRYLRHASRTYRKDGKPTSHVTNIRYAMRALRDDGGAENANAYSAPRLAALRDRMIKRDDGTPRAMKTVNTRLQSIKDAFGWAREKGLVTSHVLADVMAVKRLRKGRSAAKNPVEVQPVAREIVDLTIAQMPPVLKDMVELLWIVGCRPQEICTMRGSELETTGEIWLYRPRHKLEHLEAEAGEETVRFLGPRAQAIVKKYLKPNLSAYLFSPREAHGYRLELRRQQADPKRKRYGKRLAAIKRDPTTRLGDHYTTQSFRKAIHWACRGAEIEPWNPNQLRHAAATRLRKTYGIEDAAVQLGHKHLSTTLIYAQANAQRAIQIAKEVG